jgi:guanylate kinase
MTRDEFLKALPELVKNYQPSPDVLKQIGNLTLCMIVGPSGVGKSTMIEHSGFVFVPSDTTRDPRPGEQQGVDMYFHKDYDQVVADIAAGRFVQIALGASGDLYATKDTSYPTSGIATMPIMADVIPAFRGLGFQKTITAFITPPSYKEWMRRIKKPGLSEQDIQKRLPEAKRSFEFVLSDKEVHFILNDQIEDATKQLKDLMNGQIDTEREAKAKRITIALLSHLSSKTLAD